MSTLLDDLRWLHDAGYGVTVNLWADDEVDAAVMAWLDGKPFDSAHAESLEEAVGLLVLRVKEAQ